VIATFSPTNWFNKVDLPTLGLPIKATNPERKPSGAGLQSTSSVAGIGICIYLVCWQEQGSAETP
jgi:hypothetical protein